MPKKFVLIFVFFLTYKFSYANQVNPEFTGEWYESASLTGFDSCLRPHYAYENKLDDKKTLVNRLFAHLPDQENCRWQKPSFIDYRFQTDDYPSDDFEEFLKKHPGSPRPEEWAATCTNEEGEDITRISKIIQPSYRCPTGTRMMWDINPYCTDTPKVCMADIVGRNLKTPVIDDLGHVGLTSIIDHDPVTESGKIGNYVLEVLADDPKIINFHTLESFIESVPDHYWGEVYDLPNFDVDFVKGGKIISVGLRQQAFDPEYTMTTQFREGRYLSNYIYDSSQNTVIKQRKIIPAKFRCDTFVLYCYSKLGANIRLAEIYPRQLYLNFIHKRTDVLLEQGSKKIRPSVNLVDKNINESNFYTTDNIMIAFLNNPSISHQNKIDTLFQQLKSSETLNQYSYILDTLSSLNTIEFVPNLINLYKKEQNIQKRMKILSSLRDLVQIEEKKSPEMQTIINIKYVQNLLLDGLQHEKNPLMLRKMITYSMSILPMNKEIYTLIMEVINKLDSDVNNRLDTEKKYFYLFAIAFSNENMQKWLLPKLLKTSLEGEERTGLESQLYFFLKELAPSDIEKEAKHDIEKYIKTSLLAEPDKNQIKFDKFYALATVTSNNVNERNHKVLSYVLRQKEAKLQATYINNLDKEILELLSENDKKSLHIKYLKLLTQEKNLQQKAAYASTFNLIKKLEK